MRSVLPYLLPELAHLGLALAISHMFFIQLCDLVLRL